MADDNLKSAADETPKEKRHANVPRTCFAKHVLQSDDFCALSPSSRLVYVYCACYADNHGVFSTRAKPIRDANAEDVDFDELVKRGFVLDLTKTAHVYVLRHNWINNCYGSYKGAGLCPLVESGYLAFEGEPYYSAYSCVSNLRAEKPHAEPEDSCKCMCERCGKSAHYEKVNGVGYITCPTCNATYRYER